MSQAQLLSVSSPSVSLHQGRPATNSLQVAKFFGKRHDHVARSIQDLIANTPKSFSAPNFGVADYTDEQGKPRPMYHLYRDGFMLLVMGYTGKKALAMKLAYIEAFNRMEAELAGKAQPPALAAPLSTAATRAPLRSLVNAWAQVSHQPHAALWAQVKAHFQISRIDDLPEDWLPDALSFVQGKIDACQHTTALPSGALPSGNSSEIPNTSALPATRTPVDPRKLAIADKLEELIHELCLMRRDVRFSRGVDNRFADMHGLLFRMAESNLYAALDLLGAGARLQDL